MVYDNTVLIYLQASVVDLADTDTANKIVVVNGADQNLGTCIRISSGAGM